MTSRRALLALLACALLAGCTPRETPSNTSRVLTNTEIQQVVPGAIVGDSSYAQVDSVWLKSYYGTFRSELFRLGVTKWDSRFDCNHFATFYAALAQAKFYAANFHGQTKAQSLAVGTLWYHSARGPHAIVVAITNRGVRYIEPQTGRELQLTGAERNSAFLVVF